jgi:hypothetical protein
MPYFIFNDSTGKQRADFYQDQINETILWQGESVDAFIAETGFSIAQLGGFVLEGSTLTFNQALKDAHDNATPPITLQAKRQVLVDLFKALPIETRLAFQQVAVTVDTALQLGDIELALANLELAKLVEGADIVLLDSMITLIEGT